MHGGGGTMKKRLEQTNTVQHAFGLGMCVHTYIRRFVTGGEGG